MARNGDRVERQKIKVKFKTELYLLFGNTCHMENRFSGSAIFDSAKKLVFIEALAVQLVAE